jgi:hypothetical protein
MKEQMTSVAPNRVSTPTPSLRFIRRGRFPRLLQQAWEINIYIDGRLDSVRIEWRDVPTVDKE